jgi:hypothetical protein
MDEGVELLKSPQRIAVGRETPDHFMNRLLHGLNLGFHQGKLNPGCGWPSTSGFGITSHY